MSDVQEKTALTAARTLRDTYRVLENARADLEKARAALRDATAALAKAQRAAHVHPVLAFTGIEIVPGWPRERKSIGHEFGRLLKALAKQLCSGELDEEGFVAGILRLEADRMKPAGFNVSASNTRDDWTVVKVRMNTSSEPCASFEFLPATGEFREVGYCDRKKGPLSR